MNMTPDFTVSGTDTRFQMSIGGPAVSTWGVNIRKNRLILSLKCTADGSMMAPFSVTGPDGVAIVHRLTPSSGGGRIHLSIPCKDIMAHCTEIVLDMTFGTQNLQETIPIRCATVEDYKRHLEFRDNRTTSDGRRLSREIIAGLALRSSQTPSLEPHYRIASAVVHTYKAIELPDRIALPSERYLDDFEALALEIFDQKGDIRSDGLHLWLSILTVGWHRALAAGDMRAVMRNLRKIHDLACRLTDPDGDLRNRFHLTQAKNVSISLLFLAYIHWRTGKQKKARETASRLFLVHLANSRKLENFGGNGELVTLDPVRFFNTLGCGHNTYLALCINAVICGKNRSIIRKNLDETAVLTAVLRAGSPGFKEQISTLLAEYVDSQRRPASRKKKAAPAAL